VNFLKLIRFITRGGIYKNIVDSMVNPIIKYLSQDQYTIMLEKYDKKIRKWSHPQDNNTFDVSFFSDVKQRHGLLIVHGIADKNYRNVPGIHNFDYIGVSGNQLWIDKLVSKGVDKSKIVVIGYPKLDPIFQNRNKQINSTGKINVLYAPTHNTQPDNPMSVSSYPRLVPKILNFYSIFNMRTSTHPANETNHDITFGEELEWADVVIADAGSTLYEAWALNIPVVFPDWLVKDNISRNFPGSFEEKIYKEKIGYHANNINHMEELIYQAYKNGLDDKTKEFSECILPSSIKGKSGKIIADFLLNNIGGK